ncbi:DUF3552 domain-containing protein, partial [bacterium]|nr:DUF3552 domain-containing protein [bacterium]
MDIIVPILAALVALVVGGAAGYVFASKAGGTKLAEYEAEREKWRQAAESKSREAEDKIRDATARAQAAEKEFDLKVRDTRLKIKEELDQENDAVRARLKNQENRIRQKSDAIDKKGELLDKREVEVTGREKHLIVREKALVQEEKKYHALVDDWYAKVERAAGMTAQDAKKQLVDSMINEAKHDAASEVRRIEDEAREEAEKKAQKIIAIATQRVSTDYVNENSVSVVHLPNEDMKGRIIGREGRNIRALEAATGVDFIVDDTPEAVIISAHNPIRRAVARRTLEHLIEDGRIHPARIEEIVEKFTQEIERDIVQAGEQATLDAGVHGLHPELMKLLGRLKY